MAMLSKGRSTQVLVDDNFLVSVNLRQALEQCTTGARRNYEKRKEVSLKHLRMNDGRHVMFSGEARAGIDPKTVESIRCALHPVLPCPALLRG